MDTPAHFSKNGLLVGGVWGRGGGEGKAPLVTLRTFFPLSGCPGFNPKVGI